MKRIIKFQDDFDSQGALTIYVYCDRGVLDDANNKAYMIASQAGQNSLVGPSYDWIAMSSTIQYQEADVLYIFDSCYA